MENKGKLLVSTQAASGRKIAVAVLSVFMFILGIFYVSHFDVFREMGKDILDSKELGNIIGIAFTLFFFLYPLLASMRFYSYCNVYESGVCGVTALNIFRPNNAMKKFDVAYNEILNVSDTGKSLILHTQYADFEVLVFKNGQEALKEIKARACGNQKV